MPIPNKNVLGNPNVTEGDFQIALESLRESIIGSGKAYDSANTYAQYDTCVSGGITYYSKVNGNIGNTPAVNTYWGDKADLLSGVVHKTGNETISGVKEFTSNPLASNATEANIQLSKTGTGASVFYPYNGATQLGLADTVMGTIAYMNKTLPTDFIINKNLYVVGNIISTAGGGIGYGTGSGGSVVQPTNKYANVVLNKHSGQITMNNAASAAGATVGFQLQNSLITDADTITISFIYDGSYDASHYDLKYQVANGSVIIWLINTHTTPLSDAVKLKFNIYKGANS